MARYVPISRYLPTYIFNRAATGGKAAKATALAGILDKWKKFQRKGNLSNALTLLSQFKERKKSEPPEYFNVHTSL